MRIEEQPSVAQKPDGKSSRGGRLKDVAIFARQLGVLVRTGTPLADALHAIVRQVRPGTWQQILADVHRQVVEGTALAQALSKHPGHFDPVCRSLVAAGESSGKLDEMLDRLARLTRQQLRIRRTVVSAMIYPILLAVIGVTVIVIMLGFVLPRFAALFENLDAPLPASTEVLMTISGLLRSHWWIAMAAVVVVGVGAAFAWTSPSGRRTWDRTVVRLPYMGSVACNLLTARLVRLLGVLLDSQVPMIEALQLTQESTGNGEYAKLVGEAERWVMRGEPLSSVFERSPLIAAPVTEAVRHGEHGGRLSPVLLDMADFMDEENEAIVRTTARLVEPAMLIVLGFIVAIIALSLFVPLFDLTSLAHGGPN